MPVFAPVRPSRGRTVLTSFVALAVSVAPVAPVLAQTPPAPSPVAKTATAGAVAQKAPVTVPSDAPPPKTAPVEPQVAREVTPRGAYVPPSFADLVDGLLPAVVNISSTQKAKAPEAMPQMPQLPPGSPFEDFFEDFMQNRENMPAMPASSLGSGFIVDAEKGYVITNNHVIADADDVHVTLHDDTTLPAEVIGRDEKVDLALLKVKTDKKLTAVRFGDSDKLRVGDWVLAIGNPFGLGGTVTAGIVSAESRDINAGPYDDFIQTDASINRGNSGGPMFNINGEVIGINTAIFSPSGGSVGIGFAIPTALCKPVIDQLVKYGHTRRGWIGVRLQNVTPDIAESLGLPSATGALIASTAATSPADAAGLRPGDVILSFDGRTINAMRSLPRTVAETEIGKKVELVYWRDGKKATTTITVGEMEKAEQSGLIAGKDSGDMTAPANSTLIGALGMSLSAIGANDRNSYNIPDDTDGLLVTKTDPQGEAAAKGLEAGDVIVEIDQQRLTDPAKARTVLEAAQKSGRSSVLLLVSREGEVRFVALKFGTKPSRP